MADKAADPGKPKPIPIAERPPSRRNSLLRNMAASAKVNGQKPWDFYRLQPAKPIQQPQQASQTTAEDLMPEVDGQLRVRFLYRGRRDNLTYSIERQADGYVYDFTTKHFVEHPKCPYGGLNKVQDLGEGSRIYEAVLGRSAHFPDGEYIVTVKDPNAGGIVVGMQAVGVRGRKFAADAVHDGIKTMTSAGALPPPSPEPDVIVTSPGRGRGVMLTTRRSDRDPANDVESTGIDPGRSAPDD